MKKFILIILVLCTTIGGYAQRFTRFSNDPAKTVEEMKEMLATVPKDRQKEAKDLLDYFTAMWEQNLMYDAQMAFIEEANQMLKHKFRPFPHFEAYIHTFKAFALPCSASSGTSAR